MSNLQDFRLVAGTVTIAHNESGDVFTMNTNAVHRAETGSKCNTKMLGKCQQLLQMHALRQMDGVVDMTQHTVVDVFISHVSLLGTMTEEEFMEGNEDAANS